MGERRSNLLNLESMDSGRLRASQGDPHTRYAEGYLPHRGTSPFLLGVVLDHCSLPLTVRYPHLVGPAYAPPPTGHGVKSASSWGNVPTSGGRNLHFLGPEIGASEPRRTVADAPIVSRLARTHLSSTGPSQPLSTSGWSLFEKPSW